MSGATPCPTTPIQGSSWIVNRPTSNMSRAYVRKSLHATISCSALLAHHGVSVHPPFVRQLSQSSSVQRNMLLQFGVVAVTAKKWILHETTPCALLLDVCVPPQQGCCRFWQALRHQACAGSSLHIDWGAKPISAINTLSTVLSQTCKASNHSV